MSEQNVLSAQGLVKRFGGFRAVDGVSLALREGSIHALIGPNGAGKTTCFNLLTKFLSPDEGEIRYRGRDITSLAPEQIARLGIVRSFQISAVFLGLTVLQNMRVALMRQHGDGMRFWRSRRSVDRFNARALELLAAVGLDDQADTIAALLPYGRKRALEIAMTLALDPEIMLLDEPMAGLGQEDVARIAALIRRVSAKRSILMVEHNLSVVADLSDTITVLARGAVLAQGDYAAVSRDERVITTCMGAQESALMLSINKLNAWYGESHVLHGVDIEVRRGELVTILGRNGAGKTTTLRAIAGILDKRSGSIRLNDQETIDMAPHRIPRLGVVYCPEERAVFRSLSVTENLMLPPRLADGGMTLDEIYAVPEPARTQRQLGRQPVRRRAADAGHRPHPAHRRPADPAGRADRGPGSGHRAADRAGHPHAQAARLHHRAGRAELPLRDQGGRPPLRDGAWPRGRPDVGRRARNDPERIARRLGV